MTKAQMLFHQHKQQKHQKQVSITTTTLDSNQLAIVALNKFSLPESLDLGQQLHERAVDGEAQEAIANSISEHKMID